MAQQERLGIARRHRESWAASQPFVLGVLGHFSGRPKEELPALVERRFHDVRVDTIDAVMASMAPMARVGIEDPLRGGEPLAVEIAFRSFTDFEPAALVERLCLVAEGSSAPSQPADAERGAARRRALARAVSEAEPVRQLEARWRSLRQLLSSLPDVPELRVRILDLPRTDLVKSLRRYRGNSWSESPLCRLIVRDQLGTPGGLPFDLLLADYAFSHEEEDVLCLEELGKIASAADCVFVAAAAPRLLGLASHADAADMGAPSSVFESADHAAWRGLRGGADAGELALVLPRVLARAPYLRWPAGGDAGGLRDDPSPPGAPLWSNAVYAVGARLFSDFVVRAGFAGLPDAPTGGVVDVRADGASPSAEVVEGRFAGPVAKELGDLGLIVVEKTEGWDRLAYAAARSLATSGGYLGWRMLCGRLMHGLRDLARNLQGAASSEADYEETMREWLRGFVSPFSPEGRPPPPSRPLLDFSLEVRGNPQGHGERSRLWSEIDVELGIELHALRPGRREHCKAFGTFAAEGVSLR